MDHPRKIVENFWYPILSVSDARPNKQGIISLKRFSKNLILWKNPQNYNQWVLMHDLCPHRGARLSAGSVVKGEIQCTFHGIRFNAQGSCTHIPGTEHEKKLPKSFCTQTFPVREDHGLLWMWYGTATPTLHLPWFEEMQTESALHPTYSTLYPCHFYRLVESGLDGPHIDFLHKNSLPPIGTIQRNFRVTSQNHLIVMSGEYQKKNSGPATQVISKLLFPSIVMNLTPSIGFKNLIMSCPVDDHHSWFMFRVFWNPFKLSILRRPWVDKIINKFLFWHLKYKVLPEDFAIQKDQYPGDLGMGHDRLVMPAEIGVAEYWRMVKKALARQESSKSSNALRTISISPKKNFVNIDSDVMVVPKGFEPLTGL